MTFDEFKKEVANKLVSEYDFEKDDADGLIDSEIESVEKMFDSFSEDKKEYYISSTAYMLNLMW